MIALDGRSPQFRHSFLWSLAEEGSPISPDRHENSNRQTVLNLLKKS
jgi:hypothetical protein